MITKRKAGRPLGTVSTRKPLTPPRKILRLPDVAAYLNMSESHIKAAVRAGNFPQPFLIMKGGRIYGWWEEDILNYLNERAAS